MKKEMIPKVIFRQKSELALNSTDRKNLNKIKVEKSVKNMFDYFSDEEKKALHLTDYMIGAINKEETVNLVLENGKYATKEEIEKRKINHVKYIQNANLYKCVVSFPKDYIDENISYEKLEQEFIKNVLPKFLKRVGFDKLNKMCYQASLHLNTDNPHIHFSFIEKEQNYKYYKKIGYRKMLLFEKDDINFLKNLMVHSIEKEKKYTPLLKETNEEIDILKSYFNKGSKNYILNNHKDFILESKIHRLGELLIDKESNKKLKFNSVKDKEVNTLTREIKKELFKVPELNKQKQKIENLYIEIDKYFSDIAVSNNLNPKEYSNDLVKRKKEYIDNYILNSIINYSNKSTNHNDIIKEIVLKEYKKKKKYNKFDVVKNCLTNKTNYLLKTKVEKALKNINNEMEEAKDEFCKLFVNNDEYVK